MNIYKIALTYRGFRDNILKNTSIYQQQCPERHDYIMGLKIIGTGCGLPGKIVTNNDLAAFMDTSDEWISQRTGIRQRRILSGGETLLELSTKAAAEALQQANTDSEEIDLLIVSTVGGDYKTPSMSCLLAGELGINCVTLDINMACCGFLYALNTANAYLGAGMVKKVLIVSAEALSRLTDWTDRSTCVLFGDAAAATVLERSDSEPVFSMELRGKDGWEHLHAARGTDNCPFNDFENNGFLHMDGQDIYKFAVSSITARIHELLDICDLSIEDIDTVLLHQANLRIIKGAVARFGHPKKFPHNIENYGNTSSASVPLLLHETKDRFRSGDKLILCAFGAGLASAACLLEW